MLPSLRLKPTASPARWLGLGILLTALSVGASASTITDSFDFTLNSLPGVGTFTYNPALTGGGVAGGYTDSTDGLESFSITYNSVTYTDKSASLLEGPTVFLPGNTSITNGLNFDIFGFWVVSGSCSGGGGYFTCTGPATLLGLSRTDEVFLASNVVSAVFSGPGNSVSYT